MDAKAKEIMDKVFSMILKDAEDRATSAGYSGSWGDGGAEVLRNQVRFYQCGMNGTLPSEWEKYFDQVVRESDSEYAEYLRLKKKFE